VPYVLIQRSLRILDIGKRKTLECEYVQKKNMECDLEKKLKKNLQVGIVQKRNKRDHTKKKVSK